ncbi:MAG: type II CRISPR RNA-guided endonuclease Cas9 [Cyclobacteriaceae bacterium]|nr:type II CRISPR RNA-guided endonuclease Cas9 [Cyclobacteriaceae bacterium]
MKKILGLDLGTNSIGWALVQQDFENKTGNILGMGSRIIPMSQDILGEFGKGNSVSQTAERTRLRSVRRLRERYLLRRERLHRALNVLSFLPKHYASEIDFEKRLGQFFEDKEPKLAYKDNQFVFKKSFEEMLADFKKNQPELLNRKNKKSEDIKIPYDWTIYYLRKKALTEKVEKEELAWILLNFNQKRGYYQLRGEDEETSGKKEYVVSLKVTQIEKGEKDKKNDKKTWYTLTLENGWTYSATFTSEPQWLNTEKEFLVTEELDEHGNIKIVKDKKTDKEGKEKRKITPLPSFEEIDLMSKADQDKIYKKIKAKTEITIANSGKTVGTYIYEVLLQKPTQKIRGKLVRTIDRKFYKDELKQILKKQIELQPKLFNGDLYNDCLRELYRNNEAHQLLLNKRDFIHLFTEDILFYQRPLRSQKSSIGNCPLEYRIFKVNGEERTEYLKVIPKSNPYYQEFRIWQWIYNLSIYKKEDDSNATSEFLSSVQNIENLFEFLNNRKEIEQKPLIKYLLEQKGLKGKALNTEADKYRWNYVEDKAYPCNETKTLIRTRLEKIKNITDGFLTRDIEQRLWHIIYSVTDKEEFEKALKSFAEKHQLDEDSFVEVFKKFPPFKSEYGSYSEKSIKKLLPLMRLGKHWNWETVDNKVKDRIDKIITGEFDENIKDRVREKAINLTEQNHFQALPLWLAQYIVYGRHSEATIAGKWNSVDDLKKYLEGFKQHSLRNPIVEQVVTETLRVVGDIWQHYGKGAKDFFDEIHIELGREMKNTAEDRKRMTEQITGNENTNLRIKALLMELKNDINVENVREYSPIQQEILKIYEDGVLNSNIEIPDDIIKISRSAQPTKTELTRYKLWLEQKYRSPYTGEMIPLNKLFTSAYEIEHIIPQSRYFDDSFGNKVICESAVNKLKDNQLGLEFIKNHPGEIVETGFGNKVKIFTEDEYRDFVKKHYENNRSKRNKLLLDEIPEKMIARQLNDTRYISKFISSVLSNIVRAAKNDDGVNSKNIIPGNGKITDRLKQDWGLNDIWNDLILSRFERMNQLTNSSHFTVWNEKYQKYLPTVPFELSKGFQKKRIDHRHHAMDALVVACATRDHVNLLNNQHAKSENSRYDLQNKLRNKEKWKDKDGKERDKFTEFKKPWENFTKDTKEKLEKIVVSFKQNLRVINKATNHYEKWIEKNGVKVKDLQEQRGTNWAIRKSLHKDTVSGKVELPRIKVPKGKILTATRKSINTSFDLKTIESITDTGIQKILTNYLTSKGGNPELAFSPEGIDDMNKNIEKYNDGKPHQPVYKARIFELGSKFALGQVGNKKEKYVEAAKGTNLFFAIYQNENGKRSFETIPLNEVIERQKQGLTPVPDKNEKGDSLLFHLSPNDLVYVPTEEERENKNQVNFNNLRNDQSKRIYKMVSSTGSECHFIHSNIASLVKNYDAKSKIGELGSLNKLETTMDNPVRIKECCIKLKVDRLGNIKTA